MLVIGVDEAGRGPLVGSVVAAAVAFPSGLLIDGLTDSKKLSEKKREALYEQITTECLWSIGQSSSYEIDQINICLLYTSPSPRDKRQSRMPSSA